GCSNQRIEQALTGSMNKIATLFHPKIYGGTMLLTLNSSNGTEVSPFSPDFIGKSLARPLS
ncbi:hypothetical protein, partial [Thiolapillus sp.]|uniref:hypothetical protein n=1 Tax=Thiolapillus sp. TaxID=2017437 RepID=UPI003AF71F75